MGFKKNTGDRKSDPVAAAASSKFANIVHLSGFVEYKTMGENRALILVRTSDDDKIKFVPCTLYGEEDAQLADQLDRFDKGDHIELIGYCRPYSQKVNEKWENHMNIRITEIKSKAPERQTQAPAGWGHSEDIPY